MCQLVRLVSACPLLSPTVPQGQTLPCGSLHALRRQLRAGPLDAACTLSSPPLDSRAPFLTPCFSSFMLTLSARPVDDADGQVTFLILMV